MTKTEKDMAEDPPRLVQHKLCGNSIFYYFGSNEDAKALKNFNDLATLDGDGIVPDDIVNCKHCGERIRIDQLEIVEHQVKTVDVVVVPTIMIDTTQLDQMMRYTTEQKIKQEEMLKKAALLQQMMDAASKNKNKNTGTTIGDILRDHFNKKT